MCAMIRAGAHMGRRLRSCQDFRVNLMGLDGGCLAVGSGLPIVLVDALCGRH